MTNVGATIRAGVESVDPGMKRRYEKEIQLLEVMIKSKPKTKTAGLPTIRLDDGHKAAIAAINNAISGIESKLHGDGDYATASVSAEFRCLSVIHT